MAIDRVVGFDGHKPVTQEDCWQATIELDPGPPVVIRESQFKVLPENNIFRAVPLVGIASGECLDHQGDENFKAKLEQIAAEKDFFDTILLTHEVAVDPEQLAADIQLEWQVGPSGMAAGPSGMAGGVTLQSWCSRLSRLRSTGEYPQPLPALQGR